MTYVITSYSIHYTKLYEFTNGSTGGAADWLASGETISTKTVTADSGITVDSAWVHESAMVKPEANVHTFGSKGNLNIKTVLPAPQAIISDIEATLEGTAFTLDGVRYEANILSYNFV